MCDLWLNLRILYWHLQLGPTIGTRWSYNPYWEGRVSWRNPVEIMSATSAGWTIVLSALAIAVSGFIIGLRGAL